MIKLCTCTCSGINRSPFTWCYLHSATHSQPVVVCLHQWWRNKEGERKRGSSAPRSTPDSFLLVYFCLFFSSLSSTFFCTVPPLPLFLLPFFFFSPRKGLFLCRDASVPQFEEAVPGACADTHTVTGDAGAAHPVVVAGQHTWERRRRGVERRGKGRRGRQRVEEERRG